MEFTVTKRGAKKLLYEGYAYIIDKRKDNLTYWRCERRGECGGRLKTLNDVLQTLQAPNHSHLPDPNRVAALKAIQDMKERAVNTEEVTSTVLQACTSDFPLEAAGALPKKDSLSRMIRRQRKIPDGNVIPDELKLTIRKEPFVVFENESVTIMATSRNLNLLAASPHWFCDGTFQVAPIGLQVYTIHVLLGESNTVPLVYCITEDKNKETYDIIFSQLKQSRQLEPISITVDFEMAAIRSIRESFPNVQVYGCFFHFGQCLWRQIQSSGLQTWYNDPKNAMIIKSIQALAFVPCGDVIDLFTDLMASLDEETDEVLGNFLSYFESTWIGEVRRGRRRRPRFDISMWNVNERTLQGLPRTNNSVEGWHHAFQRRVAITHPTICRLVTKIRREQSNWELTIEQALAGIVFRAQKRKYQNASQRLLRIVQNYLNYNGLEYLRAIAHNV